MISVTQLRAGKTFSLDSKSYQVIEYKHTKLGRGTANIRVKARNLKTGTVEEKTFVSGAKVESLETEVKTLQFLWQDEDDFYFMNPIDFEQYSLSAQLVGEKGKFLQEERKIKVLFAEDQPLSIELPNSMIFKVSQTGPGVKGDTATAVTKLATLENGLEVKVPLFIKMGDKVKIDTRTGEYVERATS